MSGKLGLWHGGGISYGSASSPLSVKFADGPAIDAFNRQRVSTASTQFDYQAEYGLDTLRLWDAVVYDASGAAVTYSYTNPSPFGSVSNAAGSAVGPRNTNTRMVPLTVTADNGDYAILQSRQYPRYVPGKGLLTFITGVFAVGASPAASFVLRTSTGGSASDLSEVAQANWNIDSFGAGAKNPSGITIDFTKTQILFIQAQWLGVGRVVMGFDINGILYPAHQFIQHANVLAVPYSQTFNLPVRWQLNNDAGSMVARVGQFDHGNGAFLKTSKTAAGGTINYICCSVQSEGGEESKGFPHAVGNGVTTIGVTTRRPVLSLRPAALLNFLTNRGHIQLSQIDISASSQSAYWELVLGGTLTGASWLRKGETTTAGSFVAGLTYVIRTIGTTDFTLIGAASNTVGLEFVATGVGVGTGTATLEVSMTEYDISASAIVGGVVILSGTAPASGAARAVSSGDIDIRGPLTLSQIDALTPMQGNLSVVCTSYSATSNVSAAIHWHEKVV